MVLNTALRLMQYVHELTWVVHLYICSKRSSKTNNDYLESHLTTLPVGMSARSLQLTVGTVQTANLWHMNE